MSCPASQSEERESLDISDFFVPSTDPFGWNTKFFKAGHSLRTGSCYVHHNGQALWSTSIDNLVTCGFPFAQSGECGRMPKQIGFGKYLGALEAVMNAEGGPMIPVNAGYCVRRGAHRTPFRIASTWSEGQSLCAQNLVLT